MATITRSDEATPFTGYRHKYYPERLSDVDLDALGVWASHCRLGNGRSELLAAYLFAVQSFERQRRDLIADGREILEAILPELPCHRWSTVEVVAALIKAAGIQSSTEGEVHRLMSKIFMALLVEASYRLDPANEAGI